MTLTTSQARAFYDRFGTMQDRQAFYEDSALDELVAHARFDRARSVFELGCGTGRLARRLLDDGLPAAATYTGIDLSSTMIRLAEERISPYRGRATVTRSEGTMRFEVPDHSADRIVCTYVLDLLAETDIADAMTEFRRIVTADGLVCLANFTEGVSLASRIVPSLWTIVYRIRPTLVGGCRPVRVGQFLDCQDWSLRHRRIVTRFGIPSEVTIAAPRAVAG